MNIFNNKTGRAGSSLVFILFLILSPAVIAAEVMGESGGYDLDDLLKRAESDFDLSAHDAVLLLESRKVTITTGGDLKTRIHRVVWIGTGRGIRDHADLRIPWNSAYSRLEVIKLRTWRDGTWWPDASIVSGTAVVETLPYAIAPADDYVSMRETMLLHEGIELPCVMETVYEIVETGVCAEGCDGIFVMQQTDPAALVEFTLATDAGVRAAFRSGNGVPGPVSGDSGEHAGEQIWTMEKVGRIGSPILPDAASYAPYVAWSTWKDWAALATALEDMFDGNSSLEESGENIDEWSGGSVSKARTPFETAGAIASLIEDNVRSIHYPSSYWMFKPRRAGRVWSTAYGNALDRGVLAAALFEKAGMSVKPYLVSLTPAPIDLDLPGLSRFGDIRLIVSVDEASFVYDPYSGSLESMAGAGAGYTCWLPGTGGDTVPVYNDGQGSFEIGLDLGLGEDGAFDGTGYFIADGMFSSICEIAGGEDGAAAFLGDLSSSLIPGLEVTRINPERIDPGKVRVRFDAGAKAFLGEDKETTRFTIGGVSGGIIDNLPRDLHLYESRRDAPIFLRVPVNQTVKVSLDIGERKVIHLPEDYDLKNEAGTFMLRTSIDGGRIVIERSLELTGSRYPVDAWPRLRALLLEEMDEIHRTVVIE